MIALDLFAGTGWGVACQRLGIEELGVEIMPEAVATRTANGMRTIFNDVWDGLEILGGIEPRYQLLIASPPCPTFSVAGRGNGRLALDDVVAAIQAGAYRDPALLRAFGEKHDPLTALVLSPLSYIWRDRPEYVALEQVTTVLPVWQAYAEVMRSWGYSVQVDVLNAEQYGVPQTRRRAVLVACLHGPAKLPVPTHSRYYSRDPRRLDPGVLPWVSMAEALGWGMMDAPMSTICAGNAHGVERWASGGASIRKRIDAKVGGPDWAPRPERDEQVHSLTLFTDRLDVEDASILQTYPPFPGYLRSNYGSGGDPNARGERTVGQPAPTVTSKIGRNKWDGQQGVSVEEASALQTYPGWGFTKRPAMTVQGHGTATRSPTGQKQAIVNAAEEGDFIFRPPYDAKTAVKPDYVPREDGYLSLSSKYEQDSINCSPEENAVLQTYEPPFIWCGTKIKKFQQIGNAVPPLLAERILGTLLAS